ncbi:GNAT family N-acetyltransferase [Gorillibacterium massiliense]|uniref:GNAT family N-acetyltransferase n=1 Tax=Gorillibacterium massiliense TaxID=1280390 RepID=UPI000694234F|nr:GNAT family N-acetyltransferase [Gorillibacterium massiliense]
MIRKRKLGDFEAIYRLVKEELVPLTRKSFPQLKVTRKELKFRLKRGETYVASDVSGRPVGFLHAVIKEKELWIDMLAVAPGSRGRGYGTALMVSGEK